MANGETRPLTGLRVVIAEDSWHLAEAIRMTVEQAGGVVAGVAASLPKAEKLVASETWDAVVLDLDLRGEDASGLALQLADGGRKVVVLTGFECLPEFRRKVHACLTKPAETKSLIDALAGLMPGPRG